jgi:tetratricopeptide (TPR) repeat protein
MSLLDRLFGGARNRAFREGVALFEQERYAEAVDRLREASLDRSDQPSGSLASFHFRQALVARGRELLRSRDPAAARGPLGEAARLWDQYPDLHCLNGTASGLAGDWEAGLQGARSALRRNPDYAEARLLEAAALVRLGRRREAAASLNALVESGRRVEHWLVDSLAEHGEYREDDLPEDLESNLATAVSGRSEKEEVASAVAQCRAGHWEEGLRRFAALVRKRPRYPDYRTRHAAALFHLGRNDEALAEIEAALALNESYRTAIDLKGLVLADAGRLGEAAAFLAGSDAALADARAASAHEQLFGAYLRGVLGLLAGRPEDTARLLADWPDLRRNFARAEVLLAAADDLRDRTDGCRNRLESLVAEWPAEPLYFFLAAAHHLRGRRYEDAAGVLARWPSPPGGEPDLRPLYLEGLIAVCRGQEPRRDAWPDEPTGGGLDAAGCPVPGPEAWSLLRARADFLRGEDRRCWETCEALVRRGAISEKVVRLQILAAAGAGVDPAWTPSPVLPDSFLPGRAALDVAAGRDAAAASARHLGIHPEDLTALWMQPAFWLRPVRGWIA